MSYEAPKLYANKPKKGQLSENHLSLSLSPFVFLGGVLVFKPWMVFSGRHKQHKWKNFKSSNKRPTNFLHHHRRPHQWGFSLQFRHLSSPQKSHLLGVTSFSGPCSWLWILLSEVAFFLLFLSCMIKFIYLFIFITFLRLFVILVFCLGVFYIKWDDGFLEFSLKEWSLCLLTAFFDMLYSVVSAGAVPLASITEDSLIS